MVHITPIEYECPNCKNTFIACGFCNSTGVVYLYPSKNCFDYLEIAYRKFKIKNT